MLAYYRTILITIIVISCSLRSIGQSPSLSYYLPDIEYDKSIPTPAQFLGYQVGEWHVSHDLLYQYMKVLDRQSSRVKLVEYARSHEDRPLIYLTITNEKNHSQINNIRESSVNLTKPQSSKSIKTDKLPMVIYQGYSVHGNEASGSNASLLVAYYLAAAKGDFIEKVLNELVILLDPCYNPDGVTRFASWVNSHKSMIPIADPSTREHNEAWPRGRTNHYWFDLNRDWLLLTHPESRGRIDVFHSWKPTVLTDHHEMGTNRTFFFQPGIPERTNPNTPQENQDLTEKIAQYHASALDSIGSLYFYKEAYDDFYYGKGSTYPDANGSIGILFEQASARGHIQESINGNVSFPFAIRNQVVTSLSTQRASLELRRELLEYKKKFFINNLEEAKNNPIKGFVFKDSDKTKIRRFIDILKAHQVDVYKLSRNLTIRGIDFPTDAGSYIVPLDQDQYKMAKTLFERVLSFRANVFYDVSAWTIPLAFDIDCEPLNKLQSDMIGLAVDNLPVYSASQVTPTAQAYIINWNQLSATPALVHLLSHDVQVRVSNKKFKIDGRTFPKGSLAIPAQQKFISRNDLVIELVKITEIHGTEVVSLESGHTGRDFSVGSPSLFNLKDQSIALIVGDGINPYDAGEVWYTLDKIFKMPVTHLDLRQIRNTELSRYTTIIMCDGHYNSLNKKEQDAIKIWLDNGGNIIAFKGAIDWLVNQGMSSMKRKSPDNGDNISSTDNYDERNEEPASKVLGGAIFKAQMDTTHPLCYGYDDNEIYLFKKGTRFYSSDKNKYSTPIRYSKKSLVSGYMHKSFDEMIDGSVALLVNGHGKGVVISCTDNILFRGYWWGGLKLFANMIFFSDAISKASMK